MVALETEARRFVAAVSHGLRWVVGHQHVVNACTTATESGKLGRTDSLMKDVHKGTCGGNVHEPRWVSSVGFIEVAHQDNVMSFTSSFLNEGKDINAELRSGVHG